MYALPKVHKQDRPLRPIVSTIDSPASQLSIYMNSILRNIVHDKYDVPNSLAAREKVREIRADTDDELVSFDVVSLFPSIPMELVMDILHKYWHKIERHTTMPKPLFTKIMRFILFDATVFLFDGQIHKQINGCAMGSNISPTIANIITNEIFDTVIPKLSFSPRIILKYVDDILALVPRMKIDEFLRHLNAFNTRIQFTVEREHDSKLAYLDLLLLRKSDGHISCDWFQKNTASGKILNFLSHHTTQQKLNVAFNLFHRILSLSDEEFHRVNIDKAFSILAANNYPHKLIVGQFHRAKRRLAQNVSASRGTANSDDTTNTITITRRPITYVQGLSEPLAKIISKNVDNLKISYRPHQQLRQTVFSKLKHPFTDTDKINCVYQIPCGGIDSSGNKCGLNYVGQTKNQLHKRITQHKASLKKAADENSALVKHFEEHGHAPDFENTKVIGNEPFLNRRLTLESLHIITRPTYNLRRDTEKMSSSYCALLNSR